MLECGRSNLAFESQHLLHAVEAAGIKNWVSLSEGQQGTLGWLTTNERKEQMCLLLREALTVGKIALSEHFFSIEMTKLEARNRLEDEVGSYCVVTEAAKTTFGKVRKTYTGKRAPLYATYGPYTQPMDSPPLTCLCSLRQAGRPVRGGAAGRDRPVQVLPGPEAPLRWLMRCGRAAVERPG